MREPAPLVLHVTNIPTPYRLPYLRAVNEALAADGVGFHVFFLGRGKRRREWVIGADELRGFDNTLHEGEGAISAAIAQVRRLRPSLVTIAWAMDPAALRLLLYCLRHRIPTLLFTGETLHAAAGRSFAWLRRLVRRPFFRLASGFLTYGEASTEYVRSFGVPPGRITTGLNVVDTAFFSGRVEQLRADGSAARARAAYRTPGGAEFAVHLLLVGYMIPGKGISQTLRALKLLDREDIALHLVGNGPREAAHRELTAELGLDGRTFFHGYHQTEAMPLFYAFADIVLFPSFVDVFGLVMAEAAAAALPVIASRFSGGVRDVVTPESGIVIDPHDTPAYARAIAEFADIADREAMGIAAHRRAHTVLTLDNSASRYRDAVRSVLNPPIAD